MRGCYKIIETRYLWSLSRLMLGWHLIVTIITSSVLQPIDLSTSPYDQRTVVSLSSDSSSLTTRPHTRFHEMTASARVPHCDCRTWSNRTCLVISAVPRSINLTNSIGKYHNSSWEFDIQLRLRRVRHGPPPPPPIKNTGWIYTDTLARCRCNYNKANLRDLIVATGLVILLKLDSNHRFFSLCDLDIWLMTSKNYRAPLLHYNKLCASSQTPRWIRTGVTVRKRSIPVKIDDLLPRVTLKFDGWPWKIMGNHFYVTLSFVHHFKAIGEFKLMLQSGNI